jgi:hypothetical protein
MVQSWKAKIKEATFAGEGEQIRWFGEQRMVRDSWKKFGESYFQPAFFKW